MICHFVDRVAIVKRVKCNTPARQTIFRLVSCDILATTIIKISQYFVVEKCSLFLVLWTLGVILKE